MMEKQKVLEKKKNEFCRPFETALLVLILVFGGYIFLPRTAEAFSLDNWLSPTTMDGTELALATEVLQNNDRLYGKLPPPPESKPKQVMKITATAYSSEVGQTDSTPFITASGTTVRRGVVAANFLPIGTKVRFPDLYGDEIFVVEDRMNRRFNQRVDIWMEETADAKNFGVQWTTIEIF